MVPSEYAYLVGIIPFLVIWLCLFIARKDLRRPMLAMSALAGVFSMITAYLWWTHDWWQPSTITGTRIGVEDFLIGFGSGGIMAAVYEEIFRKRLYKRRLAQYRPGGFTLILVMVFTTSFLVWFGGLTSFLASSIVLIAATLLMWYFRRDLVAAGILTGFLMMIVSFSFYYLIIGISPGWVSNTYLFNNLSGILITGIPIEELIFWFLIGVMFGPFYEYWQNEYFRKLSVRSS